MTNRYPLGTAFDVWYEGEDDRECVSFSTLAAAKAWVNKRPHLHPIIDVLDENGSLLRSIC